MIEKNEVLAQATALGLSPDTVEKDYVLSWVLDGINKYTQIGHEWLFKGGTCLKKCYFETYRFSEDLDFTLANESHLTEEFLKETFTSICNDIHERTGIEFFPDRFKFKVTPRIMGESR